MGVSAIVAMTKGRLIGRGNDLPWRWPEDLAHFKKTTQGHTVLMGRRSWDSMRGPLPGRENLVVSRSAAEDGSGAGQEKDGARWFGSLDDAFEWMGTEKREVFILGGGEIFRQVLDPLQDPSPCPSSVPERLVVTWVPEIPIEEGDVLFPFDESWIEEHFDRKKSWVGETGPLEFVIYERN